MDKSTYTTKGLEPYKLPPSYHLGGYGSACYGDPPGFPSYFLRPVYTRHGSAPANGPADVLEDLDGNLYRVPEHDFDAGGEFWVKRDQVLKNLWRPLPYDHPRVQLWIRETYRYLARCYINELRIKPVLSGSADILIYPVPDYELKHFRDDPFLSDEWRAAARKEVEDYNAALQARYADNCTPERHRAYLKIYRYYPEHTPDLELIANPPQESIAEWWQTESECPTPENCIPRNSLHDQFGVWTHPINGHRCQWCGWVEEATAVAN